MPGSHKRGVVDAKAMKDEHGFELPGATPVRMEPGDVAFHDNGCLHGSQANPSDRQRRIIDLAFQTQRRARASGQFDEVFMEERIRRWGEHRAAALGASAPEGARRF